MWEKTWAGKKTESSIPEMLKCEFGDPLIVRIDLRDVRKLAVATNIDNREMQFAQWLDRMGVDTCDHSDEPGTHHPVWHRRIEGHFLVQQ